MGCDGLIIGRPRVIRTGSSARLVSDVTFPHADSPVSLWVDVDIEYERLLVDDRLDGFLVWMLPYAMRNGCPIVCEAPVSRRLLYQLNCHLLTMLPTVIEDFKPVQVMADACLEPVYSEGGVATGWTGGVDCMFTLMKTLSAPISGYGLTHLMIMSCGALEAEDNSLLVRSLCEKARNGICRDTGLEIVRIDSNISDLLSEPFIAVSDFRIAGSVLCLQKLFSTYYVSTSVEFRSTGFMADACSYYSMFSLPLLSTEATSFVPVGGECCRLEKIKAIADFPLAHRYLHPCIYSGRNCGRCDKCVRTEIALYTIGKLDDFGSVFDVEAFHADKDWYMVRLLSLKEHQHCREVIDQLAINDEKFSPEVLQKARIMNCTRKILTKNKDLIQSRLSEK